MGESREVRLDGNTYVWDGARWYQARSFLTPPMTTTIKLNALLQDLLGEEDADISDTEDLLDRARQAGDARQYHRVEVIARRILKADPLHARAATLLCSALRDLNKPAKAVKETQLFKDTDYVPLLVSRAEAFCDLERWLEALNEITRAREAGGGDGVSLVAKRIRGKGVRATRNKKP